MPSLRFESFLFSSFVLSFAFLTQCINLSSNSQGLGPTGILYSHYELGVSERKLSGMPLKKGKSCVERIGFFYTRGNASIQSAANQGNIKDVFRINKEVLNILSLYTELCTVVWGE
ncbi:MAG: TRL-like family protein [Leptospira sp.]|nr:TRL-like family protein [Leptospira sp.]